MALGVNDPSLNPNLLIQITGKPGMVVGVMGPGTSRELTANWDSPFEQDSAGAQFERVGGVVQTVSDGLTSKGTIQSTQVWNGNQPLTFNVVMDFYAIHDAYSEVQAAVMALEQMASPQVNEMFPFGRAPSLVSLQVGRQILYPECHIENISTPLDVPKDSAGFLLKTQVELLIQTKAMVNASDIPNTWG